MPKFQSTSHPSKVSGLTGRDPKEVKPTLETKTIQVGGREVQIKIKAYANQEKKEEET